jgi:hypothetical protein
VRPLLPRCRCRLLHHPGRRLSRRRAARTLSTIVVHPLFLIRRLLASQPSATDPPAILPCPVGGALAPPRPLSSTVPPPSSGLWRTLAPSIFKVHRTIELPHPRNPNPKCSHLHHHPGWWRPRRQLLPPPPTLLGSYRHACKRWPTPDEEDEPTP